MHSLDIWGTSIIPPCVLDSEVAHSEEHGATFLVSALQAILFLATCRKILDPVRSCLRKDSRDFVGRQVSFGPTILAGQSFQVGALCKGLRSVVEGDWFGLFFARQPKKAVIDRGSRSLRLSDDALSSNHPSTA